MDTGGERADIAVLDQLTWRAATADDVPALARLLAESEAVDQTGENYDEADLREELAEPGFDPARDTRLAVAGDGTLLAFGLVRVSSSVRDVDRVYLEGTVHPTVRRRGLGRRMLGWQEERGTEVHRERHPTVPGQLAIGAYETLPGLLALAREAGYTPVRWWNEMERDLGDGLPPVPAVPDGLRLVGFDRSYDEAVRLAHQEAFAGHWGSTPPDPDRWRHWFTGSRAFRPDISLIVLDGDDVAAYLLSYFYAADAEATGIREAWVGQLATRAPWRRRGLGTLLLAAALDRYRDAGYQRASLGVDTENATGALGLYSRLGFVVDKRSVTSVKSIG